MTPYISRFILLLALMFTASAVVVTVDPGEAHAQKKKKVRKLRPMGGAKGGFIVTGTSESTVSGVNGTVESDDKSVYGLNGFAIFPVAQAVRVGASIWAFPAVDYKLKNSTTTTTTASEDKSFGLDLNLLGEYVLPIGEVDGFAYGEGGFSMIIPPSAKENEPEPANTTGFNIGGGVGAQFLVSKSLALRGDVKATYYTLSTDITTNVGGASTTTTVDTTATRFMVNVGVAFGL